MSSEVIVEQQGVPTITLHNFYLTPWRKNPKVHHRTHNSPPLVVISTLGYVIALIFNVHLSPFIAGMFPFREQSNGSGSQHRKLQYESMNHSCPSDNVDSEKLVSEFASPVGLSKPVRAQIMHWLSSFPDYYRV
jgi:hypothetical protein